MSPVPRPVFPRGKNLGGAAVHYAAEGENKRVEGEVAARTVADLVVGYRVKVLVDQPGWVVVPLWEVGAAGRPCWQGRQP
jgi:hypothetical protein